MRRGYIRASARVTEKWQREKLEAAGVSEIYTESKHQTLNDLVRTLRAGDDVIVTSLDRLAPNRKSLQKVLDALPRGVAVEEAVTGRRSTKQLPAMIFDAVNALASDHRTAAPEVARRNGAKGGRPVNTDRLADDKARAEWHNTKANRTNHDALLRMPGWSQRMAYLHFGKRGTTLGGRPPKSKP